MMRTGWWLLASLACLALASPALASPSAALTISLFPAGAVLGILGMGLLFGIKHATEADHIAAVGAIVSEQGGLSRALLIGGLWGTGHTLAILLAGILVVGLRLTIPEPIARGLEFCVALMIIALGGAALTRALRNRPGLHVHRHAHASHRHAHLHFHDPDTGHLHGREAADRLHADHTLGHVGYKPLLVGMMHGLAGSAALTLLVLAQIRSVVLGLTYLLVFGAGSIGGMALMSLVISLPFTAAASRPMLGRALQVAAGAVSLGFGLFYAWSQVTS
jgi:ABC-type nickel/cobalt efflux system permease component RcnA